MPDSFEKKIGFADHVGTVADVSANREGVDDDQEGSIHISIGLGMCRGAGMPTVEAARQLAAALLDAVDVAEKRS